MNVGTNQTVQTFAAAGHIDPQVAAVYSVSAFAAVLGSLVVVFTLFAAIVAVEKLAARIKKGWTSRKLR